MNRLPLLPVLFLSVLLPGLVQLSALGCGLPDADLPAAAKDAISTDPATAAAAIRTLRAAGPAGLQALLTANADTIKLHELTASLGLTTYVAAQPPTTVATASVVSGQVKSPSDDDATWQRLNAALDQVSGQHDCHASRLYWYTDLDAAKAAAEREHKPILSLRLLGKLTDEYSCANSRFFRTTLYANEEVGKVLRERFILHWQSVRPVPVVTIDFGDGRKIVRTLTGNSIHYVLDSEGRVIDALPGLYGPKPFLHELTRAEQIAQQSMSVAPSNREKLLTEYHLTSAAAIHDQWQADLRTLGIPRPAPEVPLAQPVASTAYATAAKAPPTAVKAGARAIGKGAVEMPMLRAIALDPAESLKDATTDAVWARIAELHRADVELDAASVALIRSQNPAAGAAATKAFTKYIAEDPLVRMVRNLQGSIALDTVHNQYLFHRQIHQWLAAQPLPQLDTLNDRVYAELFLTPRTDPWLGLLPADTYTALENGGVRQ